MAVARVVHATSGMPGEGAGRVRMTVTLELTPPGNPPYRTTVVWLVDLSSVGSLQPGSEIQVKVDTEDQRIVYPGGEWASVLPK